MLPRRDAPPDLAMNPQPSSFLSRAWLTVLLLWPVAMLNYLDRQIFSTMQKSIMAEITDIGTEAAFGSLMSAFLYSYGFLSPLGGYAADRFNRRWVIIISLGVWSFVTWLTGQAHTFNQLWWARALMGVSEACYIPAGLAMIADFHTSSTRSRAVGIHQSGIKVGIIVGGMGGYIADSAHGWRAGFEWFGVFGMLYAVVLYACLCNPPRDPAASESVPKVKMLASIGELLCIGSFCLLVLYTTLPALPNWIAKSWLPSLLRDAFHLGQGPAGKYATLSVMLGTFAGLLLGGWIADRWHRRNIRGRIYTSAIGMTMCIPALVGFGSAPSLAIAIAFLVVFGIGWGFFDTNQMPILCQIVRPELRATGFGLMNMASTIVGGFAVDWMGKLRDAKTPQSVMFNICALAAAVSVVLVLLIRPKRSSN
jgi:MFS family permease